MLLMIDNYDSFTYNVVQFLGELGAEVQVYRNDAITLDEIEAMAPDQIVLSPGPCTPDQAGISLAVVERFAGKTPILGICLGHQSIGQAFGGASFAPLRSCMESCLRSTIRRPGFFGFVQSADGHAVSFSGDRQSDLPDSLEITAWTEDENGNLEEIMAVRHKSLAVEGVQFHPESIMSEHGHQLLENFLQA